MKNHKTSELQTVLTVTFVACFLIANILAGKQFQLPFGITMTGAVIIFPMTYILSDVFSEVYGYRWSRLTCYMAFGANVLMAIVFAIAITLPAAPFWTNQEGFSATLGNAPRILLASLAGYVVGDYANDVVFQLMKKKHEKTTKGFVSRAILSSVVGELADSTIFIPIAFAGEMPIESMLVMGATQVVLKVAYEIVVLPLTNFVVKKVSAHEARA
nr:MAG TPA: putative vitamin uptake transporter [Caudoviricetes sp.]